MEGKSSECRKDGCSIRCAGKHQSVGSDVPQLGCCWKFALEAVTRVNYKEPYETREGKETLCASKSDTARPRREHEEDGDGGHSQRENKQRPVVPQLQFHVWFWMMALCHEAIERVCFSKELGRVRSC